MMATIIIITRKHNDNNQSNNNAHNNNGNTNDNISNINNISNIHTSVLLILFARILIIRLPLRLIITNGPSKKPQRALGGEWFTQTAWDPKSLVVGDIAGLPRRLWRRFYNFGAPFNGV